MNFQVIPKKEAIPSFDRNVVAVKHIEYYPFGDIYEQNEIHQEVILKILKEIPEGFAGYFFLDPDGEMDWMEVVSDGEWIYLGCCFDTEDAGDFSCAYSYNPEFADTAELLEKADFSDKTLYTSMDSGGQSPIPKIQAITDLEAGIQAVEYFIYTGQLYPGIDWITE